MRKLHGGTPGKKAARPETVPVRAKPLFRPNPIVERQKIAEAEKARFRELAARKTNEYVRLSGELILLMDSLLGVEKEESWEKRRPALRIVGKVPAKAIPKKELLEGMMGIMNEVCIEAEIPRAARIYSLMEKKCPSVAREPENALGLETLREALRIMQEAKDFLKGVEMGVLFDAEAEEYEELVLSIYQMKYALSSGAPGKWEKIIIIVHESDVGKNAWEIIAKPGTDSSGIWIGLGELFQAFEDTMLCKAEYFIEDREEKINIQIPDWREFYGKESELQDAKSFAFRMNALLEIVCEVDRSLPGEDGQGNLIHVDFRKKE